MRSMGKALKPTSVLMVILLLLAPVYCQTASAAMIETKTLLAPAHQPVTRDFLRELVSREDIQKVLESRGITPEEARARIDSLSDDELEKISQNIADLPAGGNVVGFIVIVGAVIIIAIVLVEYFSEVKMFPQLYSDEKPD